MKRTFAASLLAAALLCPLSAFAAFTDSVQQAQSQVNALSSQQLDALNTKTFTDAFIAAKIIGYNPSDIAQLKADVQELKSENAQLRAQLSQRPAAVSAAPVQTTDTSALADRVASLEQRMSSLQGTLGSVVSMLTLLLAKL